MDNISIYNSRPERITQSNWDYLFTIIGKHFKYHRTDVTYPHGDTRSIHPKRIQADYSLTLYCDIVFDDYYMAEYAFGVDNGVAEMFKQLKQY